jgi:antitoxin VapB
MALNIKNPEADRLARELVAHTGETITEAVVKALRERLKRVTAKTPVGLKDEIMAISRRAGRLPRRSGETPEQIIGYDERGKP